MQFSGVAVEIINKLASHARQETRLWRDVNEELEKLRMIVSTVQAVLVHAEEQYSQSPQVKVWVDLLKEAFYDADDLLDEFSTDVLLKQMMTGNKMVKEVCLFFSSSNSFAHGLKMAHKIQKVRSKLDEIAENKKFHLDKLPEKTFPMIGEREQTHSSLPQLVVGREDDKKKIIDFLLSSSHGENVSIISIVAFMVTKDNSVSRHSGGLGELRDLNNLGGNLEIMNLQYVKNATSEFKAANLKEKQHLQTLRLSWKLGDPYDNNSDSGPDDVENDEEMSLEELRPHLNLKWLIVFGCGRLLFPSWISSLTNLVELRIDNCKKCQHFPPLDQFPSLECLTIEDLTDLEFIESGINCDNALFFPSLDKLWLENCPNLKGWRRDTSTPQLLQFTVFFIWKSGLALTHFIASHSICPTFGIDKCQQEVIGGHTEDEDFGVTIYLFLFFDFPFSIDNSAYRGIEDLEVLPEDLWHLPSLEGLVIKACEELDLSDDMQWQYLRSLREFQLINLNKLASLPKGLQHVPTLRKLSIESCPNLKSLPEWMESLTAIEALWIEECPQLSERCKNILGADWPKIAHIPSISIDNAWIQLDGC
ncbi:hypothetical protein GH714_016109 [Hevea brasiliensis]|uniref:Uncharacterized protein n=1 Tax=Hevea brasiliensis TaxID=3981 RepID=A0A6A6N5M2_HEVBR|nr:hypothetical protein GH714_016109 [Hevea brasiliensis]